MKKELCALFFVLCFASSAVFAHPNNDLILATKSQDALALRVAFRMGANVNHLVNERTALMIAAEKEWLVGVRILLEEGGQSLIFRIPLE